MQSKRHSLAEALTSTAIGYVINLVGQLVIFWVLGIQASLGQNIKIGLFFTGISVARQYVVRRWFTKMTEAS